MITQKNKAKITFKVNNLNFRVCKKVCKPKGNIECKKIAPTSFDFPVIQNNSNIQNIPFNEKIQKTKPKKKRIYTEEQRERKRKWDAIYWKEKKKRMTENELILLRQKNREKSRRRRRKMTEEEKARIRKADRESKRRKRIGK